MYRTKDIQKIESNLENIKSVAANEYKTYYEPTLKEISEVYKAITNYVIKNNKKIYGGFAQNLLIASKNPKDAFYKEIDGAYYNWPDIADIEFYSCTPLEDIIDLTEELYSLGFKYIEGVEGIHPSTYKIFVNFINYCDITYISKNIYDNLPIININGIKCVDPHFMTVDAFRVINDPMTSYWRLDKTIKRFQKLLEYYPLNTFKANNIKLITTIPDVLKFIRKHFIHKFKLIVVGFYAYNYYISKDNKKNILNQFPYYELISHELKKDAKHIYAYLVHKYGNKISVQEYYPFLEFTDKKIEFYYDNKLILRLFGNNNKCTVYNFSIKKHTHFGTYSLVLMYLFFNYYYAFINKDKYNIDLFSSLIHNLYHARNNYLNKHNITVLDQSPFKDFTYKCYGNPVDLVRESRINIIERKNKGKILKYRYNPSGKKGIVPNYIFDNISGNQIINIKNLIFKK